MADDGLRVDFFYGLGSRYSYLASTQIETIEAETGCRFSWCPIRSSDLMRMGGRSPFDGSEPSGQYNWDYRQKDAEDWAAFYGVPYREPKKFRKDPVHLALGCLAADRLGAVEIFSRRVFRAIFVEGVLVEEGDLSEFATEVGLPKPEFEELMNHPETAAAHEALVKSAHDRGGFGVPTFFT